MRQRRLLAICDIACAATCILGFLLLGSYEMVGGGDVGDGARLLLIRR
jgi:hypothetical protein